MSWHFAGMINLRFMTGNMMALFQQVLEGVKASLQSRFSSKHWIMTSINVALRCDIPA